MIIDVFNNFIKGNISQKQSEKELEKLDAFLPDKVLRKYDMRKIKYNNKHILEYERRMKENAVQDFQLLAV
jgi:hypothetical protein